MFLHLVTEVNISSSSKTLLFPLEEKKGLLKMHVYSLFCLKYFWNFSPPVQTEVHITSIYNRGHLHPETMKQVAQRLTSPALLISGPAAGLQKKKKAKIYLALSIKPRNILLSFILSLRLYISLSLIKLWSIIKCLTVSFPFSKIWNILAYALSGNFKLPSNLLS